MPSWNCAYAGTEKNMGKVNDWVKNVSISLFCKKKIPDLWYRHTLKKY
jgi:hypothetical protein